MISGSINNATNKLADWIWQGCKLMEEEYKANRNSARGQYLKDSILDALTIHYKLLGFANDEIDSQIKGWVRMDVPQNVQEEAPIENVALEAYFDYFGAFAPIPSARNTEITDRFVQFYNCNGWLATYDRSTGEFVSEQE